jgi:hypothetical protein
MSSATQSVPMQETIIGRLRSSFREFKEKKTHKKARFPDDLKILAVEAAAMAIPIEVIATILETKKFRILEWMQKIKPTRKKKNYGVANPLLQQTETRGGVREENGSIMKQLFLSIEFPGGTTIRVPVC